MAKEVMITDENITKIKDMYESNKESLALVESTIKRNGVLDSGLSEADESFEQGFNNGIESVCTILGIDLYGRKLS